MKVDLLRNTTVHIETLVENEGYVGVRIYPDDDDIIEMLAGKTVKIKASSYPVYKNGECYPLSVSVKLNCYPEILNDIIYPIALEKQKAYKEMEKATEKKECPELINQVRTGAEYSCWHQFGDIVAESLELDTDTMEITLHCGS